MSTQVKVTIRSNKVNAQKDSALYDVVLNNDNHYTGSFYAILLENSKQRYSNIEQKELFPVKRVLDNRIFYIQYGWLSEFTSVDDDSSGGGAWGEITGNIEDQADLVNYISDNQGIAPTWTTIEGKPAFVAEGADAAAARTALGLGTAATTDSTAYATAAQVAFNLEDVTQIDYTDKAINVKAFNNTGMSYSEGSIDFGITRSSTHTMGIYAFKQGNNTTASGQYSSAFGNNTTANEYASSAFGYETTASGSYSSAFGENTTASGYASLAFGTGTTASNHVSSAFGSGTLAPSFASSAFGLQTIANEYASLAIGRFSTGGSSQSSWTTGSPIFKVGNGTAANSRSNAYVLNNDGTSTQSGVASYKEDYSENFVDRSLVDKGYVDSKIPEEKSLQELFDENEVGGENTIDVKDQQLSFDLGFSGELQFMGGLGGISIDEWKTGISGSGGASLSFYNTGPNILSNGANPDGLEILGSAGPVTIRAQGSEMVIDNSGIVSESGSNKIELLNSGGDLTISRVAANSKLEFKDGDDGPEVSLSITTASLRLPVSGSDRIILSSIDGNYLKVGSDNIAIGAGDIESEETPGSRFELSTDPLSPARLYIKGEIPENKILGTDGDGNLEYKDSESISWDNIADKPAVVAEGTDQATARASIGAGTSNLELGSTATTAMPGNTPIPAPSTWVNIAGKPDFVAEGADAAAARTALGLGTAATTDSTAYATAAQGALASTSVQPADLDARLSEAQRSAIDALVSPETDYTDMTEATVAIKAVIDALKAS